MLKKISAVILIFTLPAAFLAAADGWRVDGLSITDREGGVVFRAPVPFSFRFTTSYIHSVELTPVEDEYAVTGGRIWTWQERVKSSNAGMPSLKPEGGIYINTAEWLIFQGGRIPCERFFLRVGNSRFGLNKLKIRPFGEASLFSLLPGERLSIEASSGVSANSNITETDGLFRK